VTGVATGRFRTTTTAFDSARDDYTASPMTPVLSIAAVVAIGLAAYLVAAMLAPERFS